MKTALALCLILGTFGPVWAQGKGQPVYVTPFTVLENHPSCNGTGKIAFQVAFAVKGAMARFGVAGQPKADARACAIRTRRGSEVMELKGTPRRGRRKPRWMICRDRPTCRAL